MGPLCPCPSFQMVIWARTQGPHDPLLPRGPMSFQSAPAPNAYLQSEAL
ncbi:unnamed protein product [Staurois parvus]|uniref:Uncharacterized protein n=1 Tax=Staurois parvus TaxID=386267 RepID=A0ABN9C8Y9_9NEOB|nr:unnamed protein product [Staurois parvus]